MFQEDVTVSGEGSGLFLSAFGGGGCTTQRKPKRIISIKWVCLGELRLVLCLASSSLEIWPCSPFPCPVVYRGISGLWGREDKEHTNQNMGSLYLEHWLPVSVGWIGLVGFQAVHDGGTLAGSIITDCTTWKARKRRGERASQPSSINTHVLHIKTPVISSPWQEGVEWGRAELYYRHSDNHHGSEFPASP